MFNKKTIADIEPRGQRVLVRVDFNVPIDNGVVQDDTRIRAALPTINNLLERGAAVLLCSHLGRPKDEPDPQYSLKPVADYLATLVSAPVKFCPECVGPEAEAAATALQPGEILLLENTRFYPGETKNDPQMATQLAKLADIYVNDAFGSAHRAHASTEGVAKHLPAVAGLLMEQEIRYLGQALAEPRRPFVAILGGAKVSDKIGVIRNLLTKADQLLIGGGMANTFLKALGYALGDSLVEAEAVETAKGLLAEDGDKLHLPVDVVIADAFDASAQHKTIATGDVPEGWRILDIGAQTTAAFSEQVAKAGTVVWNGPMGVFEMKPFAAGTFALAQAVADSSADSIIGGGDSVAAVQQSGLADKITHISTGGGASLEMLEGKLLPGLAALQDKE
ncbi:MAG: phosphoglycerate kinase [Anaerolineales bacterium]|nr:phosphoglycerate kinase [Anaerolineales bacterium]MCW5855900.1 phosphoglycerate kinase [Anaerolineales bacterium]